MLMPMSAPRNTFYSDETYIEAAKTLKTLINALLFVFEEHKKTDSDIVVMHLLARCATTINSICELYKLRDFQGCWMLHRCLMERLFHLFHLHSHNGYDEFEKWSFLEQYAAVNRVRSVLGAEVSDQHESLRISGEQKNRERTLRAEGVAWRRPKPEDVAKAMNMKFLYVYGYDYGSMHIHPMANDGHEDFYRMTGLQPAPDFPQQTAVLANSLVIASMLVQQGLLASTMRWRTLIFDYLDAVIDPSGEVPKKYQIAFLKILDLLERELPLCDSGAA
jgi:hypothetical protein